MGGKIRGEKTKTDADLEVEEKNTERWWTTMSITQPRSHLTK